MTEITKEILKEKIPDTRVWANPKGEKGKGEWMNFEKLSEYKFFLVYTHDGADSFAEFSKDKESLIEDVKSLKNGDYDCDGYGAILDIVVCNGEDVTDKIETTITF